MHAYMIIAHNQFELLEKLITALDDERNAIFLHIDAKVRDFDFEHFGSICKKSKLYFTPKRINITWGDYSQPKTEMLLLKTAAENENPDNPFTYYHLLSGVDLPIKSNDYIHSFLEKHNGKEFVHFTDYNDNSVAESRIRYYHLFRRHRNTFNKVVAQSALRVQMLFGVNRLKNTGITPQKGCNWFSITGDFARYIVERLDDYKKLLQYSYCGDEVFIQSALMNSPFKDNLFSTEKSHFSCLRLIDWERGNPYVWRLEDYKSISESECLFARKFDLNTDSEIIDKVLNSLV